MRKKDAVSKRTKLKKGSPAGRAATPLWLSSCVQNAIFSLRRHCEYPGYWAPHPRAKITPAGPGPLRAWVPVGAPGATRPTPSQWHGTILAAGVPAVHKRAAEAATSGQPEPGALADEAQAAQPQADADSQADSEAGTRRDRPPGRGPRAALGLTEAPTCQWSSSGCRRECKPQIMNTIWWRTHK